MCVCMAKTMAEEVWLLSCLWSWDLFHPLTLSRILSQGQCLVPVYQVPFPHFHSLLSDDAFLLALLKSAKNYVAVKHWKWVNSGWNHQSLKKKKPHKNRNKKHQTAEPLCADFRFLLVLIVTPTSGDTHHEREDLLHALSKEYSPILSLWSLSGTLGLWCHTGYMFILWCTDHLLGGGVIKLGPVNNAALFGPCWHLQYCGFVLPTALFFQA